MSNPARVAVAAVLGVLIAAGAFFYLGRPNQPVVGGPDPSPTAVPSVSPLASAVPSASVASDYSTLPGRILVEHLGNAIDGSEMPTTDSHPERRRFYFMDPKSMTGATAVEFLPGQPATGKTAADISSDSTRIVFQDFSDRPSLYEAKLDGTGFHKLAVSCDCSLLYPDYDPTATKVVFVRVQAAQSWLEILDLATGKITKLASTVGPSADAVPEQPAWSPDGKTIAFTRLTWGVGNGPIVGTIHYGDKPPTSGALSLLDVVTGKVHDVTLPAGELPGDVNWAPDSTELVYTSGPASTTGSNAGMPSNGGARRVKLDGTGFEALHGWGGPEYLPDGQHILVQDNIMWISRSDLTDYRPVNAAAMDLSDLAQGYTYIGHWIDAP